MEGAEQYDLVKLTPHIEELINAGIPRHDIIKKLLDSGLSQSEAEQLFNNVKKLHDEAFKEARKKAGIKDLWSGLLLFIVGEQQ